MRQAVKAANAALYINDPAFQMPTLFKILFTEVYQAGMVFEGGISSVHYRTGERG